MTSTAKEIVVESIKVIEYTPDLASALADMWNHSQDGWGGGNSITTTEQVLQRESTSDNIHLFLALDGERVVGYCSLSEYREDEGALYVPLLNVRPAYHGKKIGKLLLLKVLEKAIELKWPRLDLYTWAGNTKAVPLYKKCGFFWEERDDTTHLMNFIPSVLQTEAISAFFQEMNWYEDSMRHIEVKPDGIIENQFDYFEYAWQKNGSNLRVQFERRGRGLRLIETDDYLISAIVENLELVFGREYKILYRIVNKTGKNLDIHLNGVNNKNITFDYQNHVHLPYKGELEIESMFYLGEIEEEQSIWRTHPTVTTNTEINGKKAVFKIGVVPKFPALITLQNPQMESYIGKRSELYIDIENNFQEDVQFTFELPQESFIELEKRYITMMLLPKEKKSLPISYTLNSFGFYGDRMKITATLKDGNTISFYKRIGSGFQGIGGRFSGECEKFWTIFNGRYFVSLNKLNNSLLLHSPAQKDNHSSIMQPKLGKPYSSEFSKKKPEEVSFFDENGAIGLRATYISNDFPEITMTSYTLLYSEGLVKQWYEIENRSSTETTELWLNNPLMHNIYRSVFPYDNGMIEMTDAHGNDYSQWESKRLTENWIFSRGHTYPRGLCWSQPYHVHFNGWFLYLEAPIGKVEAKQKVAVSPFFISIGAYQQWEDFRAFANKQVCLETNQSEETVVFFSDQHNPFVEKKCTVTFKDQKLNYLDGKLTLSIHGEHEEEVSQHFSVEDQRTEASFDVTLVEDKGVQLLSVKLQQPHYEIVRKIAVFRKGHTQIKTESTIENDIETFKVDNGHIQIKAAPQFFPSLYSMVSQGNEWLDSAYPTPTAKAWWNPWAGGIRNTVNDLSSFSLLKEERTVAFVSLADNKQNEWNGLKISAHIQKHEKYKGLVFHQYFLLLPSIPIVCHMVEIEQQTGSYFKDKVWVTEMFVKPDEDIAKGWLKLVNSKGELQTYYTGKGEMEITDPSTRIYGSSNRAEMLHVFTDEHKGRSQSYMNKDVTMHSIMRKLQSKNDQRFFTSPIFYIFAEEMLSEEALSSLENIRFK